MQSPSTVSDDVRDSSSNSHSSMRKSHSTRESSEWMLSHDSLDRVRGRSSSVLRGTRPRRSSIELQEAPGRKIGEENPYASVDFLSAISHVRSDLRSPSDDFRVSSKPTETRTPQGSSSRSCRVKCNCCTKDAPECFVWLRSILTGDKFLVIVFLFLLGLLGTSIALGMDYCISGIESFRKLVSEKIITSNFFFGLFIWSVFGAFFALLACLCVQFISKDCQGSGIPELKSILCGIIMDRYLSLRAMVAKVLGLTFAIGSGLLLGKEGPMVHIAAALTNSLLRIPCFKYIKRNDFLRFQMLATACAVGVAATFGAPFGGVLFSIEVTSTYYLVSNLWKGVFAATIGSAVFYVARGQGGTIGSLFTTNFGPFSYTGAELIVFVLVGIASGLFGAFFVYVIKFLVHTRRKIPLLRNSKYLIVIFVAIATVWISYPFGQFMRKSQQEVINEMFSDRPIREWMVPNVFYSLVIAFVVKFVLCCIAIVLPIPTGLFTPVFLLGAVLGRLIGETLSSIFPSGAIVPGGYAVVGAAALASGVTRTLSTSVIAFELTGELSHLLPMLLATVSATAVGNIFNISIYDTILTLRNLPYLQEISNPRSYDRVAGDLMRTEIRYLTLQTDMLTIAELLSESNHQSFPVVNSSEDMILLGTVQRNVLVKKLIEYNSLAQKSLLPGRGVAVEEAVYGDVVPSHDTRDFTNMLNSQRTLNLNPRVAFAVPVYSWQLPRLLDCGPGSNSLNMKDRIINLDDYYNNNNSMDLKYGDTGSDEDEDESDEEKQESSYPKPSDRQRTAPDALNPLPVPSSGVPRSLSMYNVVQLGGNYVDVDEFDDPMMSSPKFFQADPGSVEVVSSYLHAAGPRTQASSDPFSRENDSQKDSKKDELNPISDGSSLQAVENLSVNLGPGGLLRSLVPGVQVEYSATRDRIPSPDMISHSVSLLSSDSVDSSSPNPLHQHRGIPYFMIVDSDAGRGSPMMDLSSFRALRSGSDDLLNRRTFLYLPIDPAPFQISELTPLARVHFFFTMLGISHLYVVSGGQLVGIITKKDLIALKL